MNKISVLLGFHKCSALWVRIMPFRMSHQHQRFTSTQQLKHTIQEICNLELMRPYHASNIKVVISLGAP